MMKRTCSCCICHFAEISWCYFASLSMLNFLDCSAYALPTRTALIVLIASNELSHFSCCKNMRHCNWIMFSVMTFGNELKWSVQIFYPFLAETLCMFTHWNLWHYICIFPTKFDVNHDWTCCRHFLSATFYVVMRHCRASMACVIQNPICTNRVNVCVYDVHTHMQCRS